MNLTKIYQGLKEWRYERGIITKSQKENYIVDVMEKFGELSSALRDYETFSNPDYPYPTDKQEAEQEIINALCNISVLTINAGEDIPDKEKISLINQNDMSSGFINDLFFLVKTCGEFACYPNGYQFFNDILLTCASVCKHYGFNFETVMIKKVSELKSS